MKKKKNDLRQEAVSPVIGVMLMLVVTIIIAAVVSGFAGDMGLDKKTGPSVSFSEPAMDFSAAGPTYEGVTIRYTGKSTYHWTNDGYEETGNYQDSIGLSYLTDTGNPQGLVFTHTGGDPIDLKDLQMGFSSNDLGIVVDYDSLRFILTESHSEITDASEVHGAGDTIVTTGEDNFGPYTITTEISGVTISGGYTVNDIDDLINAYESATDGGIYLGYFTKIDPETPDDTIIRTGDRFEVAMDGSTTAWAIQAVNDGVSQSFGIEPGTGNEWILSHRPSGQILARGDLVYPDTN